MSVSCVPPDKVQAHFASLVEVFPTMTVDHLAHLAGVSVHTARKPIQHGRPLYPTSEAALLAVQPAHVRLLPPAHVPVEPVVRHVRELLTTPGVTVHTIGKAAGVAGQTIHNMLSGKTTKSHRVVAAAILGTTAEHALERSFFRPIGPTRTRLRALEANGWPVKAITAMTGHPTVRSIPSDAYGDWVFRTVADAVAEVYYAIGDTPGPSNLARWYGRAAGYLPPKHYDDDMNLAEDDPDDDYPAQMTARTHLCAVAWATIGRLSNVEVAKRMQVSRGIVEKARERAGVVGRPNVDLTDALDGVEWKERTEVLDNPGIDYIARLDALRVSTGVSGSRAA